MLFFIPSFHSERVQISCSICTLEDQLDRFSHNTQATNWIEVKKNLLRFTYFCHAFPITKYSQNLLSDNLVCWITNLLLDVLLYSIPENFYSSVVCISTHPMGSSKYGTTCKNTNLLLTEREGRTGEYWPEVVAVLTERSEVRTKTTEGQYSPVQLEQARLVSSLLYGIVFLGEETLPVISLKSTSGAMSVDLMMQATQKRREQFTTRV